MLKWLSLALAALVASLTMAAPASAQSSNRIKCESWNYQPAQCAVGNIVDVRLVDRLGGNCRQGPDWRFDRRSIFVNNGCRAVFEVRVDNYGGGGGYPGGGYPGGGYPPPGGGGGYGQVVRCESSDYRTVRCPMNTNGGVRISRQISNAPCQMGRNWNFDRGGVWVKDGCRAEFVTGGGGGGGGWGGGGGNTSDIIECSSRNYQPARCNANINRGATVDRVLGGECIQGRTWGWDNRGIWVNNGCRARFRIY